MNYDLFNDYFDLVVPRALAKNYVKQKMKKKQCVSRTNQEQIE